MAIFTAIIGLVGGVVSAVAGDSKQQKAIDAQRQNYFYSAAINEEVGEDARLAQLVKNKQIKEGIIIGAGLFILLLLIVLKFKKK